jgi:hypothetical protein
MMTPFRKNHLNMNMYLDEKPLINATNLSVLDLSHYSTTSIVILDFLSLATNLTKLRLNVYCVDHDCSSNPNQSVEQTTVPVDLFRLISTEILLPNIAAKLGGELCAHL